MIKYFCDVCGQELTEGNYGKEFLKKTKDGYIAQLQIGSWVC